MYECRNVCGVTGMEKCVIIRQLYGGLQPVAHCLIGRSPEGFSPLWPFRGKPYVDLMHIAGVGKRHQASAPLRILSSFRLRRA